MTSGLILCPGFQAENGVVLFEGRPVPPAKRAAIKSALNRMGERTDDVPTLRLLASVQMSLIATGVAAVNQSRAGFHAVSKPPLHPQPACDGRATA